jgi:DNA polymerase
MLNFYDFEVFKYDWMVVIINPVEKTKDVIVNDKDQLERYYHAHKNEIWVGYNSQHYDQYILKAILCGFKPQEMNDWLIRQDKPGWQFSRTLNNFKLYNYDVMLRTDQGGLKRLEAMMGNNVKETTVPFDIDRKLTAAEIAETIKYCTHDVEQTIEVFLARKSEFDASVGLIKIFNLPMTSISKTKAKLVADICGGLGKHFDDEFEFTIVDTLRLDKYKFIADWYRDPANHDYSKNQIVMVEGIPHTFAWGGIHGASGKIIEKKKRDGTIKKEIQKIPYYGKGIFYMCDVNAYYPSLQLRYGFGYRNMGNPENFEKIHKENLRLKTIDKVARLPYKIADNSISGQLKDKNSRLFDPRSNNEICINGQLLLLDLIEKICVNPHIKLIQSNTDGILVKLESYDDFEFLDDTVYEWECRTGMSMEFDEFRYVYQKDVNNYVAVTPEGKFKTKGGWTKASNELDDELPIIKDSILEFMTKGIYPEQTVNACQDLKKFQKVNKISAKYKYILHGDKKLNDKTVRSFASIRKKDAGLFQVSARTGEPGKVPGTADKCFIVNEEVNGKECPSYLDRDWYIELAYERLRQYGAEV